MQKETSTCVLVMTPFLWPTLRSQRALWTDLDTRRRALVGALTAGVLLPFVPVVARMIQLSLADQRVYDEVVAGKGFLQMLGEQIIEAEDSLKAPLVGAVVAVALVIAFAAILRNGVDWITIGLFVTAIAFVAFAAKSGVVATRYYLPPLTLVIVGLARAAASLNRSLTLVVGAALLLTGIAQAPSARNWVEWWVDGERAQEDLVRQVAYTVSGGCELDVVGRNTELVYALPVLVQLVDVPAKRCDVGDRFLVVADGYAGSETPPDDPSVLACGPNAVPVWESPLARIVRCPR
jgi:hypothetical protein